MEQCVTYTVFAYRLFNFASFLEATDLEHIQSISEKVFQLLQISCFIYLTNTLCASEVA